MVICLHSAYCADSFARSLILLGIVNVLQLSSILHGNMSVTVCREMTYNLSNNMFKSKNRMVKKGNNIVHF